VELEPGTWSLDVKGYVSESDAADPANAVVTGNASVTLEAGGVTPVSVALSAKAESGAGTLVYDIRFPADADSAVLSISPITAAGNRQERDLKVAALTTGNNVSRAIIEMDNLSAGYYRLGLEVSVDDTAGNRVLTARKTAIAHIYNGLATTAAETLAPEDFANIPAFTSVADLSDWLAAAVENTKDTPYKVALRGLDVESDFTEGSDPLGKLYNALNGKYVALDLSGCTTGEVTGDATSTIAAARKDKNKIVSLVLPVTLKTLGAYAFYNCTALISLDWPFSTEGASIGEYTFSGCASLTALNLPETLETIGNYAFRGTSLSTLCLPSGMKTIGQYAFSGLNITSMEWPLAPDGATIGGYAFLNCQFLTSVTLPAGLTQIGSYAFQNCYSLKEISLPASLTQIDSYAFNFCNSLKKVSLPAGLTQINSYTFENCAFMEEVSLPASLKRIGDYAFWSCRNLRWVKWPNSSVDASLGSYSGNTFSGCTQLEKVETPDALYRIYANSFQGCSSLRVVILRREANPVIDLRNVNAFPTANANLTIYVPDAKMSDYQGATNWSNAAYSGKIVSINNLDPVDDPSNW
jgi:hypothetical protein